jgi:hypothetical protein
MATIEPCKLLRFAYVVVLFSLLYFFCITFVPIPETGEDNAKYVSGFLIGTGLSTIIAYYFKRVGPSPELPTDGSGTTDSTVTTHTEVKP